MDIGREWVNAAFIYTLICTEQVRTKVEGPGI